MLYFQAPASDLMEFTKTTTAAHGKAPLISDPPPESQPPRGHGQSTTDRRAGSNVMRGERSRECYDASVIDIALLN